MHRSCRSAVLLIATLLLPALQLLAQSRAYTAPADLDEIVQQAQTIVVGHVVSATVEPHPQFPNLQTVLITMKVEKVLKGEASSPFVFRQFIWDARDISPASSAGYHKAEEIILFLNAQSAYGLTSPVGLDQGRFRIQRDAAGNLTVVNGRSNVGLSSNVAARAHARGLTLSKSASALLTKSKGPVPLQAFEDLVQTLAGPHR